MNISMNEEVSGEKKWETDKKPTNLQAHQPCAMSRLFASIRLSQSDYICMFRTKHHFKSFISNRQAKSNSMIDKCHAKKNYK